MMRKRGVALACLLGSLGLAGCSTLDPQAKSALRDGGIGAAGGAVLGAIVPGLSPLAGAAIGGAGGAAVGAINGDHHYYHDQYGRRYYLDAHGHRVYQ